MSDLKEPVDYTAILFKNHANIDNPDSASLYTTSTIYPAQKKRPINPYIGLKATLSRTYANYYIVLLLLLLLHLVSSLSHISALNTRTKRQIVNSCHKAENAANLIALTPEALLKSAKTAALATASTTIHVTGKIVSASVHILNLIVVWVIHRYTKIVVCVFDTVAGVLLDAVKAFADVIRNAINIQLKHVQDVLDASLHGLNLFLTGAGVVGTDIENVFSDFVGVGARIFGKENPLGRDKIAAIKMPQINENLHFEIPESFVKNIRAFNPPTLQEIEHKFDGLVDIPFDMLRKLIEASFDGMNVTKDVGSDFMTTKYRPEKFTFCEKGGLKLGWVDKFTDGIRMAIIWVCWIVVGVAGIITLFHALSVMFWYKMQSMELNYLTSLLYPSSKSSIDPSLMTEQDKDVFFQDSVSYIKHPIFHRFIVTLSRIFPAKRWQYRFRWFADYTLYTPALLCIAIGILGACSILIQVYIINRAERRDLPNLILKADLHLKDLANDLTLHINKIVLPYAAVLLTDITKIETTVNKDLFQWVDRIVQKVDEIVTLVVKTYTDVIHTSFGFFPYLAETILKFITCMLGIKIEDVNAVGGFVKEAFKVGIPKPDPAMFRVSKEEVEKFVMPFFMAAYNGKTGNGGLLGSLVEGVSDYKAGLLSQLWMFWAVIAFGGSIIVWGVLGVVYWIFKDIFLFATFQPL